MPLTKPASSPTHQHLQPFLPYVAMHTQAEWKQNLHAGICGICAKLGCGTQGLYSMITGLLVAGEPRLMFLSYKGTSTVAQFSPEPCLLIQPAPQSMKGTADHKGNRIHPNQ